MGRQALTTKVEREFEQGFDCTICFGGLLPGNVIEMDALDCAAWGKKLNRHVRSS
jgi:hypothetical protein